MRRGGCRLLATCGFGLLLASLNAAPQPAQTPSDPYIAEITRARQIADRQLRGPFSPLAKIQGHTLQTGRALSIGRGPRADVRLDGLEIAPMHAVIEGDSATPTVRAIGSAWITTMSDPSRAVSALMIKPGWGFRIGRFVFEYNVSANLGRRIQVFDPDGAPVLAFQGVEYFPLDPSYRVSAEIVPYASPTRVELVDSGGEMQAHWLLYGELRFSVRGVPSRLHLYAETLDEVGRKGFMVMFTDLTSGAETYPAARYLMTEPKASGTITIDFNRAYNPPCVFSPLYTCPFPRKENRLPIRVEAGAKWYRSEVK